MHYKVISAIGSGGMGEVFLAKDNRLERKVAIKVLRKKFGKSEDSLERFVREAKAASALNHPNIITIYEIGENDGLNYIAGEFIDGKTLHKRISDHDLSISEILNITIQTCEAIAAAHAAGIIHRDIKPENIMVRKDGYVKVLDFGLAKLTEHEIFTADFDAVTHRLVQTNPGVVMGTVSYMSPEQTRGREIDSRADIWSLGVVMFEMIAGRLPFTGESTSDVIAAILTSSPPELTAFNPETPLHLESIVLKALRKNREERYANVGELLFDLNHFRASMNGSGERSGSEVRTTEPLDRPGPTGEPAKRDAATRSVSKLNTRSISGLFVEGFRRHPTSATVGITAAVLFAIFFAILFIFRPATTLSDFEAMRFSKITSAGKAEGGQAAISPDGKYVAYVVRDEAEQSLWVKNIPTDSSIQIVAPSTTRFRGITFDPDSGFIYYVVADPNKRSSIYRISVLGGESKHILTDADGPISFSPKGDKFTFVRNDRVLMSANVDGTNSEVLATAVENEIWWLPTWSPNGKVIAFTNYSNETSRVTLRCFDLEKQERCVIGSSIWLRISGLAWNAGGDGLRISGRDPETQLSQIWSVSYPDGKATRVTNDASSYQGLSLSADGKSAVSVQENRFANIWISDESKPDEPRKITAEIGRDDGLSGVAWSPDGSAVYTTRIAGTQDIWRIDHDGKNNRRLTSNSGSNFHPSVSPDGRMISFVSDRAGSLDIWRMESDGSNPTRVTDLVGNESRPSFTPDSNWIVFQRSGDDGRSTIWKVPSNGGEPTQIAPAGSSLPAISPDGQTLAVELDKDSSRKLGLFDIGGTGEIRELDLPGVVATSIFDWSADGESIIYLNRVNGEFELWSQPIGGGSPTRFSKSRDDRIYGFDISTNGKGVVFSRGTESSDVIMISSLR